jgi:hypothetical protein
VARRCLSHAPIPKLRSPTILRPRKTDKQKARIQRAKSSYPKRKQLVSITQGVVKKKENALTKLVAIETRRSREAGNRRRREDGFAGGQASGKPLERMLDVIARIIVFAKLKLTNCAPIPGLPAIGFLLRTVG